MILAVLESHGLFAPLALISLKFSGLLQIFKMIEAGKMERQKVRRNCPLNIQMPALIKMSPTRAENWSYDTVTTGGFGAYYYVQRGTVVHGLVNIDQTGHVEVIK